MKNTTKSKKVIKKIFVAGMTLAMSTAMFAGCDSSIKPNVNTSSIDNAEIVRVFDAVTNLNANGDILSQSAVLDGNNYDVTVITENKVQKYTVNSSMTIIDQKEIDGTIIDTSSSSQQDSEIKPDASVVTTESALEKAYNKAIELSGVTKESILSFDFDSDKYLGQMAYEIEIKTENAKYEYILNAIDLSVFESEIKLSSKDAEQSTSYIEQSEAISIALNAVGISDQTLVTNFKFSENNASGNKLYKIKFSFENYDYELRINAATSVIVKFEKEISRQAILTSAVNNAITEEQAKTIATELIGIANVEIKKIKIDYEDDKFIYEVKAEADGIDYEVEIDASTGEIIDFDSDEIRDDEFDYFYGKHYKDDNDDKHYDNKNTNEAKTAVLNFINNEKALITSIDVEKIEGEFFYEVEVKLDNKYVDYLVNAKTLEVTVDVEEDNDDDKVIENELSKEEALKIALDKFSVKANEAKVKKIDFNKKGECIVKYSVNDIEYTVQIKTKDGSVKNFEKRFG